MTKYLSLHYLRSKWPFSPQSRKFNIFATTTKICDQTSQPERNHNWGLHCNQIPFPAFVLKIETFLEWLQFMPASNSGPAPYAYSPDCHLVVTCCWIVVTASQRESSFYSRQSDVNHSLWFGQTQDIIGKNYLLKTLLMFNTKDTYTLSTEQDAMEVHLKIFHQISATPRLTCLLQVRSHLEQLALDRTPVGKLRAESGWSRCWIIQRDQGF